MEERSSVGERVLWDGGEKIYDFMKALINEGFREGVADDLYPMFGDDGSSIVVECSEGWFEVFRFSWVQFISATVEEIGSFNRWNDPDGKRREVMRAWADSFEKAAVRIREAVEEKAREIEKGKEK